MKNLSNVDIKERIAAIRTAHHYGLTPAEELLVSLIEDLTGANEEPSQPKEHQQSFAEKFAKAKAAKPIAETTEVRPAAPVVSVDTAELEPE